MGGNSLTSARCTAWITDGIVRFNFDDGAPTPEKTINVILNEGITGPSSRKR